VRGLCTASGDSFELGSGEDIALRWSRAGPNANAIRRSGWTMLTFEAGRSVAFDQWSG
jgi:hypothetical protein